MTRTFLALFGFIILSLRAHAAPVAIPNHSFELPNNPTTGTTWTNALSSWTGSGGSTNGSAFIEYIVNFRADASQDIGGGNLQNDQHLGMEVNYDVFQDLAGVTYQPGTVYTLTVAVGNRAGSTNAANSSVYALADPTGTVAAAGSRNASTVTAGTFADAPAITFDTFADPCMVGKGVRVLLQSRGVGRSHFDNIRLDASASAPNGRPVATLSAATSITATGATLNGTVTDVGSAAPSVIFYWATSDLGGDPAAWTSSQAVAGTQTGAFSAAIGGLQPSTTYFFRARAANASGAVWASPCLSFTTTSQPPQVANLPATEVTASTASVGANVLVSGGQAPDVTIHYGPADGGTNAAAWASSVTIPALVGEARRQLTGLLPQTVYHYRAFAQNAGGSAWADATSTFTTITVTAPTVRTDAADNVTGSSARLAGEVTDAGNDPPVVTVFWGTSNGGSTAAAWENSRVLGPDSGNFSTLVQGLTPLTPYFFNVRAVNAAGTAWGVPRSFTTGSLVPTSVIINEVHYDPPDVTRPLEFVELHNPTAGAIDMSGWRFDSGVTYVFPGGTSIPAGGYVVVAQNPSAFGVAFPLSSPALGPWVGQLRNSGELLRLSDATGRTVDEVNYQSGFPWPTAPNGIGSSMELLHPQLNNDLGGSWRAGTSTGTQITYVATSTFGWRYLLPTAEPPANWTSETFTETTWLSATLPLGYGDIDGNAANTDVTSTVAANQKTVYLRRTFTASAPLPARVVLNLRCDDGCIAFINGVEVARIRVPAGPVPPFDAPDGTAANVTEPPLAWEQPVVIENAASLLKAGTNVLAIQLINTTTASSDLFIDADLKTPPPTAATPGAPNGALVASVSAAPPAIRNVGHEPQQPAAGQDVIVTATVTDPDGVGSVNLAYQLVNPGSYIRRTDAAYNNAANWVTVPMTDDGTDGDAVAGDAVYSARLPGTLQQHRRLVRYRITVSDALTNAVTVPYADDEQPNFAYFCYNGVPAWSGAMRPTAFAGFAATSPVTFPASLLSSIEPFHLIALDSDVAACLYTGPAEGATYRGTLVYEGKVYDHILFNVRGIGSTRVSGKNKLAFKFNRARDFQAKDNWGRPYAETWNSFGLDANASPWAAVNRGSAGVEVASSYRIFELAGMHSLRTSYAHLRIIRRVQESAPAGSSVTDSTVGGTVDGQYTSDLWGLYMVLEPTEGNFLGERDLPDGNIYAIEGNNGDQKHQAANQPTGGADWNTFRTQLVAAGQTEKWYRGNVDLPRLYTYLALSRLIGNVDVRPGDNYRFYHDPRVLDPDYPGGHWSIIPYDHDMQWIAAHHWGGAINGMTVAGAPNAIISIMRHPALAQEYRNRCRELISLMASDPAVAGGQIGQLIDEYAQMVNPVGQALTWADVDAHMWNLHPRSAGGGANTGQTSHRGNFFRAAYLDGTRGGLGGTVQTASWRRDLTDTAPVDGFSDHESMMQWFVNYATNTWPGGAWTRRATNAGPGAAGGGTDTSVTRQQGYGFKYLEWESLYGGYANANVNPATGTAIGDLTAAGAVMFPDKPTISHAGTAGFPVNDVRLRSGPFADPQGDAIAAVQWRVGEVSAPGIPLYDPTQPRIYEVQELWRSPEIATSDPAAIADVRVPASVLRPGRTYRARVRHKDTTGRWSYWSDPLQFVPTVADVSVFVAALRISELNYNPGPVTPAEAAAPGWNPLWTEQEFEFVELTNVSASPVDLTDVRFTRGIDFDFAPGISLASGGSLVLVRNPVAFAIRYPGVTIGGTFLQDTGLANAGEQIRLIYGASADQTIIDFVYDDNAPWPSTADGEGPTLELIAPAKVGLDHGNPAEWRASGAANGSPGQQAPPSYASWSWQFGVVGGSGGDDDGDGVVNLMEYALGLDARSSGQTGLPTAGTTGTHATLTFTRPANRPDVSYTVQFSASLGAWDIPSVLVSSVTNPDGTVTETWRSSVPLEGTPRQFTRLRVVQTP